MGDLMNIDSSLPLENDKKLLDILNVCFETDRFAQIQQLAFLFPLYSSRTIFYCFVQYI